MSQSCEKTVCVKEAANKRTGVEQVPGFQIQNPSQPETCFVVFHLTSLCVCSVFINCKKVFWVVNFFFLLRFSISVGSAFSPILFHTSDSCRQSADCLNCVLCKTKPNNPDAYRNPKPDTWPRVRSFQQWELTKYSTWSISIIFVSLDTHTHPSFQDMTFAHPPFTCAEEAALRHRHTHLNNSITTTVAALFSICNWGTYIQPAVLMQTIVCVYVCVCVCACVFLAICANAIKCCRQDSSISHKGMMGGWRGNRRITAVSLERSRRRGRKRGKKKQQKSEIKDKERS